MNTDKNKDDSFISLQNLEKKDEDVLYKQIYKFLKNADLYGYKYTDLLTKKNNEIDMIIGGYKENNEYYKINLSKIGYNNLDIISDKYNNTQKTEKVDKTIKSSVKLEKLLNFDGSSKTYDKTLLIDQEELATKPGHYLKLFTEIYNKNKPADLPKIKNYNQNNVLLYSFAAAYGATVISFMDNTPLANSPYYNFLHLGMLAAPFVPLQLNKKTRSLSQLVSLSLLAWTTNSFSYYPVGMITGHITDNLNNLINFYKFQIGLGSGSYADKYGPLTLNISSYSKAISYLGRIALIRVLPRFGKLFNKIKLKKK